MAATMRSEAVSTRVVIIDDDPILRECLVAMVERIDGMRVVGEAGTVAGGISLLALEPDVLLLDLGLPDGSGLSIIDAVRDQGSVTRTIVLTVFADVRTVIDAIEHGADGYLLKESDVDQIATSIRTVVAGGSPISPAVASHILARLRRPPQPSERSVTRSRALTAKETEVLEALAQGRSVKEVARQHSISVHTVGDHVKSIYRKLSVNSRSEAVFKAMQSGYITVGSPG